VHELDFSYRLVAVELSKIEGREDLYNKQMLKASQKISSLTEGPAVPVHINEKLFVAIPADKQLGVGKVDVVPNPVAVTLLPELYHVTANNVNGVTKEILHKFLDFEIRKQLGNDKRLWKLGANQFFRKQPVKTDVDSNIEVYGGFEYKLVHLPEEGQFYVTVNITYKYIDKEPLSAQVNVANALSVLRSLRGRKYLYQNGDRWYVTELEGFGKRIDEHEFRYADGKDYLVLDYIRTHTNGDRFNVMPLVRPDDVTMLYKYPGVNMQPHVGAASLAKAIYHTSDKEIRELHRFSIKDPDTRFDIINKVIGQCFQQLTFNGKQLSISKQATTEDVQSFAIPELLFNNGRTLKVGHFRSGAIAPLKSFAQERKHHLLENGILNKSAFDPQFLLVPDSFDKTLCLAIQKNLEFFIKKLAPTFPGFKIIRYKVNSKKSATHQVQELDALLRSNNAQEGYALFILPDTAIKSKRSISTYHDCLKSKFYPGLQVQCASGYKIKRFFESYPSNGGIEYRVPEHQKTKFRSYVNNLALEHLQMNRKWPYALAKGLHYDIYIGIDVHNRHAGFTFFFKNGQQIFFRSQQVPKKNKSQRAEKLRAGLLIEVLYEKLKTYIPNYAPNPNGIVIIRDGRSYSEEEKALHTIITDLGKEGIIDASTICYGVVDLHKQSAIPFRLAAQTDGHNRLENPISGAYKLFSQKEGFLFNTGFPFTIPGTAHPLHLSLRSGNLGFLKVMEDIFHQSMLAFSAPDRSNSLPITIKLIDTLLEPFAATEDDIEDETEELNEMITQY
jgi:hypothetical protein